MKHFNNFKKELRDDQTPLPENLSWESMEDGIFTKIEEDKPNKKAPIFSRSKILISILSLVIIALMTILCNKNKELSEVKLVKNEIFVNQNTIFYNQDKSDLLPKTQRKSTNSEGNNTAISSITDKPTDFKSKSYKANNTINTNNDQLNNQSDNTIINGNAININKSQVTNAKENSSSTELIKNSLSSTTLQNTGLDEAKTNESSISNENKTVPLVDQAGVTYGNNNNLANKTKNRDDLIITERVSALSEIKLLAIAPFEIEQQETITLPHEVDNKMNVTNTNTWHIELGGGSNQLNIGLLKRDPSIDIHRNTTTTFGRQISLRASYRLNEKLSFSGGVEYFDMYRKLDVQLVEGIQDRQINAALIAVDTIIRTVRHYNVFSGFSAPIMINIHRNISTWEYGLGVGTSISLITNTEGRYIRDDDVAQYLDTDKIYNRISMAINGNAFLYKNLSSRFSIGLKAQISQHVSNWSSQQRANIKPTVLSGQLVGRYSF